MSKAPAKQRIDLLLKEQGLVPSREKAQALILAGKVRVNGEPIHKAGELVAVDSVLTVLQTAEDHYVSRGALKLLGAMRTFGIQAQGKVALDIGASTGGFTQVLLEEGAVRVHALDVGYGQMDWKIRNLPEVILKERFNARNLQWEDIGEWVELVVIDVSFISLSKILPAADRVLKTGGEILALIKPQFEAGKDKIGKKGIVRDAAVHAEVVQSIKECGEGLGLEWKGFVPSTIKGMDGNQEFLGYWQKTK